MNSSFTLTDVIELPFITTVWRSVFFTDAPMEAMAPSSAFISLTSGTFSMVTVSSVIIADVRIASAAFFAPLISTSPLRGKPPFITYCSIYTPQRFPYIIRK